MPTADQDTKFANDLFGHMAAVVVTYTDSQDAYPYASHAQSITSFILYWDGVWFLATAGHIIAEFKTAFDNGTRHQISSAIAFGFGSRKPVQALPWDLFSNLHKHEYIIENDGAIIDFAIAEIDEYLHVQFELSGVRPFAIDISQTAQLKNYSEFGLIGFPHEFTAIQPVTGNTLPSVGFKPTYVPLKWDQIPSPPNGPLVFTADVVDLSMQVKIAGMSGGPVLGYYADSDGVEKYQLVGIQSQVTNTLRLFVSPINSVTKYIAGQTF